MTDRAQGRSRATSCAAIGVLVLLMACGPGSDAPLAEGESAAPGGEDQRAVATMVYECPGGRRVVARIEGDTAWLFLPGRTVPLPHVPSGSGAKYADGTTVYWAQGDDAMIESPDLVARGCRNDRREAVWEHAKLNGAQFRAVGNEPGWHMEIARGERIVLVTDYGASRDTFPAPRPQVDRNALRSVYRVSDGEHQLVVTLEGRTCLDTMADESYGTTVTVVLDGRELRGCGRVLF